MLRFIFALVLVSAISADTECPSGWIFHPDTTECYFISTKLFTLDESIQYCQSIGGASITISSYTEKDIIAGITNSTILQPWLGVKRNTTNGKFYNIDNSYFYSYMWIANEPSVNGDCVTFKSTVPYGLQVTQCYQLQPALCRQTPALCNGGVFGGENVRSGTIKSPGYPVQYYNNLKCQYLINSPNGTYITIDFTPFLIEEWYDSVNLYEGNSTSYANSLGQVSSYSYGKHSYESNGNQLNVYFQTNYAITSKGWLATWNAKKIMPDIRQTGTNGTMTSPNYPSQYDTFDEQKYIISVSWGMQINMTIDDFFTESRNDYLQIYNSSIQSNNTLVATLSGMSVAPYNFISPGYSMSMKFVSDGSLQYRGWHMYWAIC